MGWTVRWHSAQRAAVRPNRTGPRQAAHLAARVTRPVSKQCGMLWCMRCGVGVAAGSAEPERPPAGVCCTPGDCASRRSACRLCRVPPRQGVSGHTAPAGREGHGVRHGTADRGCPDTRRHRGREADVC